MKSLKILLILTVVLSFALTLSAQTQPSSDDYLTGYITAILQHELKLSNNSYRLDVTDGSVTIVLKGADRETQKSVWRALQGVPGVMGVTVKAQSDTLSTGDKEPEEGTSNNEPVETGKKKTHWGYFLPSGDVFQPLIADPKQPKSFVSLRRFHSDRRLDSSSRTITMASVGYGGVFGIYRQPSRDGNGVFQVGMDGALFAQFNMDAPSHDLINADYTIGIPLTYKYKDSSLRLRLYHQSSHLGDEYILRYNPDRVNLSYEAVSLTLAREWGPVRLYGGGEYRFDVDPAYLGQGMGRWGLEYRGTQNLFGSSRPIAGMDIRFDEVNNWDASYSLKTGLEFGSPDPRKRHLRLYLVGYQGYSPYGQFYADKIRYYGLEVAFSF